MTMCVISECVVDELKRFRFNVSPQTNALILKIIGDEHQVVIEKHLENCTVDEIRDELPSYEPRYVLISYCFKHSDERVSYPLCFVFCSPPGAHPNFRMLYAGGRNQFVSECGLTKTLEIRDPDELTQEILDNKAK